RGAFEQHRDCIQRLHAFEYYGERSVFGGCAVPLVDVCAADLAYYQRAGAGGVSCLTFGRFSLLAYGTNVEAFARGAIRPADARAGRATHCARRFGPGADAMRRYVAVLEAAMARVVTYGDIKVPPAREAVRV